MKRVARSLLIDSEIAVQQAMQFYDEINSGDRLQDVKDVLAQTGRTEYGQIPELELSIIYVLCRLLRPAIVLETGVAAGVSSAYILQALQDNSKGELYSIDAPNMDSEWWKYSLITLLPPGKEAGWAVPNRLKSRWKLIQGRSREKMPRLLDELGQIDIFLHDSEHTPENMVFECKSAYEHIRKGGVMLFDDLGLSEGAIERFCKESGRTLVNYRFMRMGAFRVT